MGMSEEEGGALIVSIGESIIRETSFLVGLSEGSFRDRAFQSTIVVISSM